MKYRIGTKPVNELRKSKRHIKIIGFIKHIYADFESKTHAELESKTYGEMEYELSEV